MIAGVIDCRYLIQEKKEKEAAAAASD